MTSTAQARVQTTSGRRYLTQFAKHLAHRFPVEGDTDHTRVELPLGALTMSADDDTLQLLITSEDPAFVEQMKSVVSTHVDRFAHREGPLRYDWRSPDGGEDAR